MFQSQTDNEIERLFAASPNISDKVYNSKQVEGLPTPVKRYFQYSLQEDQPYISYVRLKHKGQFRQKQKWQAIKGQEYFTVEKPGFIWIGKVPFFKAKDKYYDGQGNLQIKLFSFIPIINTKGKEWNQGELLRWLGEAPWFPTALLPSEKLRWEPIDEESAKVILSDKNLTVEGTFYFNNLGQATQFKAKRYKDGSLEDWTGFYSDYRMVNGIRVPFYVEVVWNLDSGDFSYAKFTVDLIEYDIPMKFD
ncbi:MAG: hypothetical protein GF308_19660 [Candidatus Heimdallarchaeota archaeon]|nr:hypothetical protein [Candidatus Heimdallarchaeota archaeon]